MASEMLSHYKATIRLSLPIALGQLGVIVMGFADTMMVGHYGTDPLAAASFVTNVFNLITFLMMGYSYGLTPLISARCGRGEKAEAGAMLKLGLGANVLFGTLLLCIMGGLYFGLHHLGQPEEILPLVRPYYLVILFSMAFVMVFNTMRQFTDGTTDTTTGMWILLTGNGLNIVGNYLLIYGVGPFPELGLLGAGIATLGARAFMAVAICCVVLRKRRYAPFREGFARERLTLLGIRRINAASLPVSLQMGMETGSFTFSAIMAGWLGAIELAVYQVMMTIGTMGFLFYYSFGAGMSIRIATFMGTNDLARVKMAARAGRNIELMLAALAALIFIVFVRPLVGLFTPDQAVTTVCIGLIVPLGLYQFSDAMQICYANALRGTGHVMSMMYTAFVSYLIIGLPASYLLSFTLGLGISGIFYAFSLGLFTAAALFFYNFRRVTRRGELEG